MSLSKTLPWLIAMIAGCGGGETTMQTPGSEPAIGSTYTGDGTYYGATGAGACGYDPSPGNLMVAAMNAQQWNSSAVCGMCVEVTGPKGPANKIVVRIVDLCPECKQGDLDLSEQAFSLIAEKSAGRVPITWQPVACSVSGPVSYKFKDGSSQYWMAIQVRNSRLPVSKIELLQGANALTLKQESYGYYIQDTPDPGPGPFTFRVTSLTGQQITDSGIPLMNDAVVQGTQQF